MMNQDESGAGLPALPDPTTEDRWLQTARDGDRAAYDEIIAAYQDRLYDYAARISGEPSVAARVTALSLRRLAASGFILGESNRLTTRLYTIARDLTLGEIPTGPAAESEPTRSAVVLRELHGLGADEAGQVLDRDPTTVTALIEDARFGRPSASAPDAPADAESLHAPATPLTDTARKRITQLLTSAWPALPGAAALTAGVDTVVAAGPQIGAASGAPGGPPGPEPSSGDAGRDAPFAAAPAHDRYLLPESEENGAPGGSASPTAVPPTAAGPGSWPVETGATGAAGVPDRDGQDSDAVPKPQPGDPDAEDTSATPGGDVNPDDAAAQQTFSNEPGGQAPEDTRASTAFTPFAGAAGAASAFGGRDPDWDDEATSRFEFPPREERPGYPPPGPAGEERTGFLPPPPPPPEPPTGRGGLGPIGGPLLIGLLFGMVVACGILSLIVVQSGLLAAPPTGTPVSTPTRTPSPADAAAGDGTATPEATGTNTATPTATPTPTATATATASRTATVSPSPSRTSSPTATGTAPVTPSPAATATSATTVSPTPGPATATPAAAFTATPVPPTGTATALPATATRTVTPGVPGTPTAATATPGAAPTPTNRVNGQLEVQPGQVTFGPSDSEYTIAVINRSVEPLGWQASPSVPWLAVDPPGGILPSSSQDPLTIILRRNQLPAGAREGRVILTSDNGRIELPVVVTGQ